MAHATLTLTLPEELWIQQVSTQFPEATFRVLAAVPGTDSGFALVRIASTAVSEIVDAMDDHSQLTDCSLVQWDDDEATIHFETTAPLLLFSSRESGMPIELPVEIEDGQATIDAIGSRERLSAFADQLEYFGLEYRIEHVRERFHEQHLLSDRQREVLVTAVDAGYYDTPRCCSLTDVATRLGIAKSTCSEILHRAEGRIVKGFVNELPDVATEDGLEERLAKA
ncbi:helix-turn-helix domain-containing protein [Haloarchaeobius amylolyticus]|uniref:Helix-turn-helix domain-containing protein n=1 Tax=Haloarchaeobius amylolyticus TaxID=1198296 RepID=A0ABD6BIU9_9EURY